jgi:3-deoxy-D-manno-octulosonic-acid transferase
VLSSDLKEKTTRSQADVVVVDEMGILGKLYFLADVAFIGGSLVPCGGHNPLEPAAAEKAILFGPYMSDFQTIAEILIESGAAIMVEDSESLYKAAFQLLQDRSARSDKGKRAFEVFQNNRGAVKRILAYAETYLKH